MKKRKIMEIEDIVEVPYAYLDRKESLRQINDFIHNGYKFVNLTYFGLNKHAVLVKYK